LEQLYTGPQFKLAERYAQTLTTIFIAFMLASGMPIMYLLGFLGIAVTYWTDKFVFLRLVKTPPQYDAKIAQETGSLLPYAIILHCIFGIWMYSNYNIFQFDDSQNNDEYSELISQYEFSGGSIGKIYKRVTRQPVVFMVGFLLVLTFLAFIRYVIIKYFAEFLQSICPIFVRLFSSEQNLKPNYYPNYYDSLPIHLLKIKLSQSQTKPHLRKAYKKSLEHKYKCGKFLKIKTMTGCHSYDILENKDYIDAFAMDSLCASKRSSLYTF